jgi:hypothetical protein
MEKITIIYNKKPVSTKVKVENDLRWYDAVKKEMEYFKGGKIEFEYKRDQYLEQKGHKNPYRMLPKIVDVFVNSTEYVDNKKDIIKFYLDYINFNRSDIAVDERNVSEMVLSVPDDEKDDFIRDMERNNIEYKL